MTRTTALGIPCPRDTGLSDDALTLRYRAWFVLYHRSRIVRHWLGLHDWQTSLTVPPMTRCTWCGKRARQEQGGNRTHLADGGRVESGTVVHLDAGCAIRPLRPHRDAGD